MGDTADSTSTPDPERLALLQTRCELLPLDTLAEHVAAVSARQRRVYVERLGDGYSWSFVHAGGPYPLLREVAAFVDLPHTRIIVPCRTVGEKWCVMTGPDEDDNPPEPDAWAVIDLTPGTTPADASTKIRTALA